MTVWRSVPISSDWWFSSGAMFI